MKRVDEMPAVKSYQRMNRLIRGIALAVLIVLSLVSCAGKTGPSNEPTATASPEASPSAAPTAAPSASSPAASAPASASPSAVPVSVRDYFPMEKDRHMVFIGGGFENAGFEYYTDYINGNRIQLSENNTATGLVHVYEISGGELKLVYREGEIYHRYNYTSFNNTDEIILKEPLKTGTSWLLKDGAVRTITSADMNVSTPSGTYTALEVTTKNDDWSIKDYYAKGIGLIKKVYTDSKNNFTLTSELGKLENGQPYKQTLMVYFPDVKNDKIIGVERTVDILTNEDMKWKFQKELKTPPENSGLSKVLTTNTQINSIKLDVANDMVVADFSSHLVKEMNAGTSYESMLLKSIAKTLGNYYQKRKVMITLDGGQYQSGHIIMKPGEYLTVD